MYDLEHSSDAMYDGAGVIPGSDRVNTSWRMFHDAIPPGIRPIGAVTARQMGLPPGTYLVPGRDPIKPGDPDHPGTVPSAPSPTAGANYRASTGAGGWVIPHLENMVKTKQIIAALTPGVSVAPLQSYDVAAGSIFSAQTLNPQSSFFHGMSSLSQMQSACAIACANEANKTFVQGASPALGIPFNGSGYSDTATRTPSRVWGWLVQISASDLNFNQAPFTITVGKFRSGTAANATTIESAFTGVVTTRRTPVTLIVLAVASAGGLYTVAPGAVRDGVAFAGGGAPPSSGFANLMITGVDANHSIYVEGLNNRDLMGR